MCASMYKENKREELRWRKWYVSPTKLKGKLWRIVYCIFFIFSQNAFLRENFSSVSTKYEVILVVFAFIRTSTTPWKGISEKRMKQFLFEFPCFQRWSFRTIFMLCTLLMGDFLFEEIFFIKAWHFLLSKIIFF
jgi:hypothetical protein